LSQLNEEDNKFHEQVRRYYDNRKFQTLVVQAFAKGLKPPIVLEDDELKEIKRLVVFQDLKQKKGMAMLFKRSDDDNSPRQRSISPSYIMQALPKKLLRHDISIYVSDSSEYSLKDDTSEVMENTAKKTRAPLQKTKV
jgi:hypothetical protein